MIYCSLNIENTHVRQVGNFIVPAKIHELRLDRFTSSEVDGVVGQLLMFESTASLVSRAKPGFTPSNMIVVIYLMSIVGVVEKEGFN